MKHKKILITISIILVGGALALSVASSGIMRGRPSPSSPTFLQTQNQPGTRAQSLRNLSLQPEAFNLGRRLGSRFNASARATSIALGTLLIGSEQRQVQTRRVQTNNGEQVEIRFLGSGNVLTWDAGHGSLASGRRPDPTDREVIERLVMDSPDQFILAQLRGAAYLMVARNVRPAGAGDDYQGPLWNIVRINDPETDETKRLESLWRLYYLNTTTGLIDRIESETNGQRIIAEFSSWTERNGEKIPAQIVWTSQGRTLMEYRLADFSRAQ